MKSLFVCSFLMISLSCFSQQLEYSIIWRGDSIGYIKVTRSITDSSEYHNFQSASNFRVILSFSTGYTCETFFENGILTRSKVLDMMNDDVRGSALVEWQEDKYQMVIDGEPKVWGNPVMNTVGSLYYEEPAGLTRIFSERFGRYLSIESEGDGQYKLTKPDERVNTYHYENGQCTKVVVNNPLVSFSFQLVR